MRLKHSVSHLDDAGRARPVPPVPVPVPVAVAVHLGEDDGEQPQGEEGHRQPHLRAGNYRPISSVVNVS